MTDDIDARYKRRQITIGVQIAGMIAVALGGEAINRFYPIKTPVPAAAEPAAPAAMTLQQAVAVINKQEWAPGQYPQIRKMGALNKQIAANKVAITETKFWEAEKRDKLNAQIEAAEAEIATIRAKMKPNTKRSVMIAAKHSALKMAGKFDPGTMANMSVTELFTQNIVTAVVESTMTRDAQANAAKEFTARGVAQVQAPQAFTILIRHYDELQRMGLGQEYAPLIGAMNNILNRYAKLHYGSMDLKQARSLIAADGILATKALEEAGFADKRIITRALLDLTPLQFGDEITSRGEFLSFFIASNLYNEPIPLPNDLVEKYGAATLLYVKHQRGRGGYRTFINDLRIIDMLSKPDLTEADKKELKERGAVTEFVYQTRTRKGKKVAVKVDIPDRLMTRAEALQTYRMHSYGQAQSNRDIWLVRLPKPAKDGSIYSNQLKPPHRVLHDIYTQKTGDVALAATVVAHYWVAPVQRQQPAARLGECQNTIYLVLPGERPNPPQKCALQTPKS